MLTDGTTIRTSRRPAGSSASSASLSQAMSTSPRPRSTNVVVDAARARIEHGHVLVEARHEVAGLRVVAAGLALRVAPGREVVPPRAPGRLRVRRDDGDPGFTRSSQSWIAFGLPWRTRKTIVDVYGIERLGSRVAQSAGKQPGARDRVDVVGEAERDHVGLEASMTARACFAEPPWDCRTVTLAPPFLSA